jgi:2-polyprenyl-3-methyl-5-hydroxy-6-metoxy-1,4-benzoquinol methylase
LCGGVFTRILFFASRNGRKFEIHQCERCQLAWTHADSGSSYQPIDFSGYYGKGKSKFFSPVQTIRDMAMRTRARRYLSLLTSRDEIRVLDVGCAEGRLLKAFLRYGCRCVGVEHPDFPEGRFLDADHITYLKGVAALETLPFNRFDLIFLWHVLEHVHEPMALVRRLHSLLSDDGLLVMAVPNFGSGEPFAFKANWFHLDVPYHRFHFTKMSLRRLTTDVGLQVVRSSEFCLEQGAYGLIQSMLNAMGWRFNECYEALKGNLNSGRIPLLACQAAIGLFLSIPALLLTALQAAEGKGAVLKMILQKGDGTPPGTKDR